MAPERVWWHPASTQNVDVAVSVAEVIVVIALLTFGGEVEKWVVPS